MSNIKIERDHTGQLHLRVGDQHAMGAEVRSVVQDGEGLTAVVFIPLRNVTIGEATNVVPFKRPDTA